MVADRDRPRSGQVGLGARLQETIQSKRRRAPFAALSATSRGPDCGCVMPAGGGGRRSAVSFASRCSSCRTSGPSSRSAIRYASRIPSRARSASRSASPHKTFQRPVGLGHKSGGLLTAGLLRGPPVVVVLPRQKRLDRGKGLLRSPRPFDSQLSAQARDDSAWIGQQILVIHERPFVTPGGLFGQKNVLEPQHVGLLRRKPVATLERRRHLHGMSKRNHEQRRDSQSLQYLQPKGDEATDPGILQDRQGESPYSSA